MKGAKSGDAVANKANAKKYWDEVYCSLKKAGTNTWWFILQDPGSNPSFGVVPQDDLSAAPNYSLAC